MKPALSMILVVVAFLLPNLGFNRNVIPNALGEEPAKQQCRWTPTRQTLVLEAAAHDITSSDSAVAQDAIATLRASGPQGLGVVLDKYDLTPDAKFLPAIDAIAGQRGAVVSRLYWYTDLDQAKSAAKTQHKPILYLRLLGKLTDEYSCANSRFFRTVLYANSDVSKLLREQFILVWCSERPVPVVTIDYGDGRKLKRTLTGNSIHYILDEDGHVIDALPGLYGPKAFAAILNGVRGIAVVSKDNPDRLAKYLDRANDTLLRGWEADAEANSNVLAAQSSNKGRRMVNPPAAMAMPRAMSKSVVETPLLASIAPEFVVGLDRSINSADAETWEKVAAHHVSDAQLDNASIAVIREQNPQAYAESGALDRTVAHFQQLIALDTVHNNYQFRRQIISWLRESPGKIMVEDLNHRVYSELFLTPASDPWLGLLPESTYSALTNDGCIVGPVGK